MNTGEKIIHSKHGLLTTLLYKNGNEKALYALEVIKLLMKYSREVLKQQEKLLVG